MTILLILFEILIILYVIFGTKKVNEFIQTIIKNKYFYNNNVSKNNMSKPIINLEDKNKNSKNNHNEIKIKGSLNRKISKEKKNNIKKSRRSSVAYNKNNLRLEGIRKTNKKGTCMNTNIKVKMKGAPPKRRNTVKKRNKNYEELNLDSQIIKLSYKKTNDFPISQHNMINLNENNNSNSNIEIKDNNKNSKKELDIYKICNNKKKLKTFSKSSRRSTMIFSPIKKSHKINL
jgi:hypothetical protein